MAARLDATIKQGEDHVVIIDIGPTDARSLRVESLGKPCDAPERRAIAV